MRKLTMSLLGVMSSCLAILPATAQQADSNLVLPDAKPGECYAKVITPARFETRTEEVVVQEASERIETQEAEYQSVEEQITVKEASQDIDVTPAAFIRETESVETRAAELVWVNGSVDSGQPVSPEAVEQIASSGVDTAAVEPGSCFVEYYTEAQYRTESVRVLVKEATQSIEIVPARFETVAERVVVKEASSEVVDVPAVYRTVTESVLVEPARSVWQEDCGVVEQVDNATGEVMCLVELPARYETLTKTVLDKPATTKTINIPAEYKTVEVEKLVSPAREERVDVPAEYTTVERQVKVSDPAFFWLAKDEQADSNAIATGREICLNQRPAEKVDVVREVVSTPAVASPREVPAQIESIEVQRLLSPASERRIQIPARTRTVSSQVEVAPAKVEWVQVLCQVNMTRDIITRLQEALKREGYDPGPIDGFVGQGTLRAMEEYQAAEGINGGGITLELLKHLKVET
ncbi:peptidoglycan-binding domain-containing protein [Granulosicoccus sp. 3-233]|uniref:peptidoglycan-binding domain-containing protein n=1 Tax=Granulosicoccus sp. 3-233 TaxID=3417969 RepID=UPI003D354D22